MTSILAKIGQTIAFFNHQDQERQQIVEQAHNWQRKPEPSQQKKPPVRVDLAKLPGYEHGMYARRYHQRVKDAIQAAMSPDISKMSTYIKPKKTPTSPLPARDIERSNTNAEISQLATLKNNPATPTPEVRAALFAEVPDVAESLALWQPDPDATDRHVIVRKIDAPRSTLQIPAMPAEMLLLEVMRKDTHEQSTGENERLPENWML